MVFDACKVFNLTNVERHNLDIIFHNTNKMRIVALDENKLTNVSTFVQKTKAFFVQHFCSKKNQHTIDLLTKTVEKISEELIKTTPANFASKGTNIFDMSKQFGILIENVARISKHLKIANLELHTELKAAFCNSINNYAKEKKQISQNDVDFLKNTKNCSIDHKKIKFFKTIIKEFKTDIHKLSHDLRESVADIVNQLEYELKDAITEHTNLIISNLLNQIQNDSNIDAEKITRFEKTHKDVEKFVRKNDLNKNELLQTCQIRLDLIKDVKLFNQIDFNNKHNHSRMEIFAKKFIDDFKQSSMTAMEYSEMLVNNFKLDYRKFKNIPQNCDKTLISYCYRLFRHPHETEVKENNNERNLPELISLGASGTYKVRGRKNTVFIIKPQQQEWGCAHNPKKYVNDEDVKLMFEYMNIPPGTGGIREVAAYKLHRFCNVPPTGITKLRVPFGNKTEYDQGSVQLYQHDCISFEKILDTNESFEIDSLQRIALMDILLLNCDRHEDNILVRKADKKLIPIDHGMILPGIATRLRFIWMKKKKELQTPFSTGFLEYINNMDIQNDMLKLWKLGIHDNAISRARLSARFLKKCIAQNLTLFDIGQIMLTGPDTKQKIRWKSNYKHPSFFESVMCQQILLDGKNADAVFDEIIRQRKESLAANKPPPSAA